MQPFQSGDALQAWPFAAIVDAVSGGLPTLTAVEARGDGVAGEVFAHETLLSLAASIATSRRTFTTPSSILRIVPSPLLAASQTAAHSAAFELISHFKHPPAPETLFLNFASPN